MATTEIIALLLSFAIISLIFALFYFPVSLVLSRAETRVAIAKIVKNPGKFSFLVDPSAKNRKKTKTVMKPYRMLLMLNMTLVVFLLVQNNSIEEFDALDSVKKLNTEMVLLAFAGPLLISFMAPRLVYEYCPMYVLDVKAESLYRFGKLKNRYIEPIIGTGVIISTLQIIFRKTGVENIASVFTFTIAFAICISMGQFLLLFLLSGRMRNDSIEIVDIYLALGIAEQVTIRWDNPRNLISERKLSQKAQKIEPNIVKKYGLEKFLDKKTSKSNRLSP